MASALVIGGTRFIGRHVVAALLDDDYSVTLLTRGNRANPFADDDRVKHLQGDRTTGRPSNVRRRPSRPTSSSTASPTIPLTSRPP